MSIRGDATVENVHITIGFGSTIQVNGRMSSPLRIRQIPERAVTLIRSPRCNKSAHEFIAGRSSVDGAPGIFFMSVDKDYIFNLTKLRAWLEA